MKKLILGLCAMVVLMSGAMAQVNVRTLDPKKDSKLIGQIASSGDRGTPFPEGSTIVKSGNTFKIQLPQKSYYLLHPAVGESFRSNSVNITCSCSGGGCSPVKEGGNVYCVMDACNVCKKSTSSIIGNGPEQPVTIIGVETDDEFNLKFLVNNFDEKFLFKTFVTKTNYFKSIDPELLKLKDITVELNELYSFVYKNNIPDFIKNNGEMPTNGNYIYVEASIYGNLILIPLPASITEDDDNNMRTVLAANAGAATCSCDEGSSGCKKGRIMTAVYCEAGKCSSCTLNIP